MGLGFFTIFFLFFFFWCRKSVALVILVEWRDLVLSDEFCVWFLRKLRKMNEDGEFWIFLVLGCFDSGKVCAIRVLVSHGWKAGALLHHGRCLIKNPGWGILICFCMFSQRPIKFCCSCTDNLNSRFWFHGCFNFWNLVILCLNSGETEERERKQKQLCFYLYFNFFFFPRNELNLSQPHKYKVQLSTFSWPNGSKFKIHMFDSIYTFSRKRNIKIH